MGGELLPCPCVFCGSTDTTVGVYDVQPDNYHGGHVSCTECDAIGPNAISLNGWLGNPEDARRAAIEAWNRRASPAPPAWGDIETDPTDPTRVYIPLPGGWEIQTKGKGSSFRLCNTKTGERFPILNGDRIGQSFMEKLGREVHAAASALAGKPPAEDGWLDISTAPKDGTEVVLFGRLSMPEGPRVDASDVGKFWAEGQIWSWCYVGNPTHWRPLPAPPNAKGGR